MASYRVTSTFVTYSKYVCTNVTEVTCDTTEREKEMNRKDELRRGRYDYY